MMNGKQSKGFTIIELLIVVFIIVIIATLVMVNFNTNRIKARNAQRMSDLREIQLALDLYYDDYGKYPICNNPVQGTCNISNDLGTCVCVTATTDTTLNQINSITNISSYLGTVPKDPINSGTAVGYDYTYARGYRKTDPTTIIRTNQPYDYVLLGRLEAVAGITIPTLTCDASKSLNNSCSPNVLATRQSRNVLLGPND